MTIHVDAAPIRAQKLLARGVGAELADNRHVQAPIPLIVEDDKQAAA